MQKMENTNYPHSENCSDEEAIENFLLDLECLQALDPWLEGLNIFEVLKITNTEIRHSNLLGWLLDPNESHGLNDLIIKDVVTKIILDNKDMYKNHGIKALDMLLLDYDSFSVRREWHSIDLLLISDKEKIVVCIENKVDSKEHSNQLNRYKTIAESHFEKYKKIFVYLTPFGDLSSDEGYWVSFSYENILEIIERNLVKRNLVPEAEILIKNYISTIRRFIVKEDELISVCSTIYKNHKRALDLIYENRPDNVFKMSEELKDYLRNRAAEKGDINYDPVFSSKAYIRFTTPYMDSILPPDPTRKGAWGYGPMCSYDIYNAKDNIKLRLSLTSQNLNDEDLAKCEKLCMIIDGKQLKKNWMWRTAKFWNIPAGRINQNDLDEEESDLVIKKVIAQLDKLLDKDVPELEAMIRSQWVCTT